MPRGDRTGPLGEGPFTGRRGGNLSPRQRLGSGWRGLGGVFGRGFGRGSLGRGGFGRRVPGFGNFKNIGL